MSRRSTKFWFITASVAGHVAFGIGVYASGIWNIDRLDRDKRSLASIALVTPPPPAPAGGMSLPKPEVEAKPVKPIAPVLTQPVKPAELKPTNTTTTTEVGSGSAVGSGSGSGDPRNPPGDCLGPQCDDTKPTKQDPPKKDPPDAVTIVPPNVLTMMRISGSTQVHPSDPVKNEMLRDGRSQSIGVVQVCVSETGDVSSVTLMKSTKYPAYDQRLIEAVHGWTYRPYAAKGRNVKVCGVVTFVYSIKS